MRRGSGSSAGAELGSSLQPGRVSRLAAAVGRLRGRVPEPVEQLDLLLRVRAHRVLVRQVTHELAHARAELVREVRRRRPDELVDVGEGRLSHRSGA